ncbi:MAG: hypothetical protein HN727_13085, partial [Opitutae bacterium]|nr:hypothetical protein [Opitutae bacterium]
MTGRPKPGGAPGSGLGNAAGGIAVPGRGAEGTGTAPGKGVKGEGVAIPPDTGFEGGRAKGAISEVPSTTGKGSGAKGAGSGADEMTGLGEKGSDEGSNVGAGKAEAGTNELPPGSEAGSGFSAFTTSVSGLASKSSTLTFRTHQSR